MVDHKRRSREEGVVFKIGFKKTYNPVHWNFFRPCAQKKRAWFKMKTLDEEMLIVCYFRNLSEWKSKEGWLRLSKA